jgi:predicted metal-dependent enzyme (double-stranded beta helix superfamily)
MSAPAYRLADFVADLELITAVPLPDTERIRRIQKKLRMLISAGDVALGDASRPPIQEHYGRCLLHEDKDNRFVVVEMVWGPKQGTPIHDHSTWGVAGILCNELRLVNYDRMDDGSKPGVAELREASAIDAPAGTVTYIQPPNDVIHSITNTTDTVTRSVHVYGKSTVACNWYDLATGRMTPWKLAYDKPCDC